MSPFLQYSQRFFLFTCHCPQCVFSWTVPPMWLEFLTKICFPLVPTVVTLIAKIVTLGYQKTLMELKLTKTHFISVPNWLLSPHIIIFSSITENFKNVYNNGTFWFSEILKFSGYNLVHMSLSLHSRGDEAKEDIIALLVRRLPTARKSLCLILCFRGQGWTRNRIDVEISRIMARTETCTLSKKHARPIETSVELAQTASRLKCMCKAFTPKYVWSSLKMHLRTVWWN